MEATSGIGLQIVDPHGGTRIRPPQSHHTQETPGVQH